MKLIVFIFLFFVSIQTIAALSCSGLEGGDKRVCESIDDSNLSSGEKDLLKLDIFNKNKIIPNHDFVYNWNTNLKVKNNPNGIYRNEGSIRNAWVNLLAVMPSVLEDSKLYVPKKGKILSKFDYNIILPSGKEGNDCKTKYYSRGSKHDLDIFVNNKKVGDSKLQSYSINGMNEDPIVFQSRLIIESDYKVKHYKKKKVCIDYKVNYCAKYKRKCKYDSTEYRKDQVILYDYLNAKLYNKNPESDFKITQKYSGINNGILGTTNQTRLQLSFDSSLYETSDYIYNYEYELPDYILTLNADKKNQKKSQNMHVVQKNNKIEFTVRNASKCVINFFTHFESFTKNCDLTFNKIDLEIKTNKLNYYEDEVIELEVYPKDIYLDLTYNNRTISVMNKTQLPSILHQNRITLSKDDQIITKAINIKSRDNEQLVKDAIPLSFLGFILYSFLKKYYIKFSILS